MPDAANITFNALKVAAGQSISAVGEVPARWWLECEGGVISGLFRKP
jgi:hypothetical protein